MKVPEDIQEAIKKLSKAIDVQIKTLLKELKEIIDTDEEIQAMDKDAFKIRFAWAKLYRQHTVSGNESQFYVMPLLYPNPMEITISDGTKIWLGEFSALVQRIKKNDEGETEIEDPTYGAGTFFRDGAKNMQGLKPGSVYKTSLIYEEKDNGYVLSSGRSTNFSEVEHKMPKKFSKYFKETIEPENRDITLGDMDLNKSENPIDIRILTVTAFDYDTGKSADGREFGYYDFMDNSITGSNYRMFLHPKDINWEKGSILKVGIRIDFDKKNELRTSPHFIIPTELAEKRELNIKPVTETETVDTSELEEEAKDEPEEKSKEEKKEESDEEDINFEI